MPWSAGRTHERTASEPGPHAATLCRMVDWKAFHQAWDDACARLTAEGWTVRRAAGAVPVQLDGRLPTGEQFALRSRQRHVTLHVGGSNPVSQPAWED